MKSPLYVGLVHYPIYDKNFAVFKNLYKSNKENFAALNG